MGAQDQNAEAEHAILTVMCMSWSFMIHVALHWGEGKSDGISLWSFAVDHTAWLYNCIPEWRSSIMLLPFATRTKFDHSDLQCTHVWGCHCVLNGINRPIWDSFLVLLDNILWLLLCLKSTHGIH